MSLLNLTVILVWPWESVRNKLRDALTELCVASDVLTIASKVTREVKKGMDRISNLLDIWSDIHIFNHVKEIFLPDTENPDIRSRYPA